MCGCVGVWVDWGGRGCICEFKALSVRKSKGLHIGLWPSPSGPEPVDHLPYCSLCERILHESEIQSDRIERRASCLKSYGAWIYDCVRLAGCSLDKNDKMAVKSAEHASSHFFFCGLKRAALKGAVIKEARILKQFSVGKLPKRSSRLNASSLSLALVDEIDDHSIKKNHIKQQARAAPKKDLSDVERGAWGWRLSAFT